MEDNAREVSAGRGRLSRLLNTLMQACPDGTLNGEALDALIKDALEDVLSVMDEREHSAVLCRMLLRRRADWRGEAIMELEQRPKDELTTMVIGERRRAVVDVLRIILQEACNPAGDGTGRLMQYKAQHTCAPDGCNAEQLLGVLLAAGDSMAAGAPPLLAAAAAAALTTMETEAGFGLETDAAQKHAAMLLNTEAGRIGAKLNTHTREAAQQAREEAGKLSGEWAEKQTARRDREKDKKAVREAGRTRAGLRG